MRDTIIIEGGIRDGNSLAGFQLVGCGIALKLIAGCGI